MQGVSEFYESVMTPGVHYLLAESPEEVPGIIRELKRNESWARVAFWAATFFFVRALEVPTAGSAAASRAPPKLRNFVLQTYDFIFHKHEKKRLNRARAE